MKYEFISSRATLATKFLSHTHTDTQSYRHTDTQTDRHFPKIVKSCSGHPKTCKSIKNRKSKICMKPILPSSYIEESKNKYSWMKPYAEIRYVAKMFHFYIKHIPYANKYDVILIVTDLHWKYNLKVYAS